MVKVEYLHTTVIMVEFTAVVPSRALRSTIGARYTVPDRTKRSGGCSSTIKCCIMTFAICGLDIGVSSLVLSWTPQASHLPRLVRPALLMGSLQLSVFES